jgi:hypothetical protein
MPWLSEILRCAQDDNRADAVMSFAFEERMSWRRPARSSMRVERSERIAVAIFFAVFLALLLWWAAAQAQVSGSDWCQSPNPAKSSKRIHLSGTGEALLVDAVTNQSIQACAFSIDLGGSTPTAEFDYGTQASTACDTGATALTGAMSAAHAAMAGPLDYFAAPAAKQLCLNLGGTNPTAEGWVTYVQK